MSNFLREIQSIYLEGGYRGDITRFPVAASGQRPATLSEPTYRGLPGAEPGQGVSSSGAAFSMQTGTTAPVEYEEERASKDMYISKREVLKYINQKIQESEQGVSPLVYDILEFLKSH